MKIVVLILLMFLPLIIRADQPRSRYAFTSPNGQYEFQTLNQPQYRKWSLIEKATKKVLYEVNGDFSSMSVLVGYDGKHLVMIDDFSESNAEEDPEVLQFFLDGKKIKSYKLSDLLGNTQNVVRSVSHFMWLANVFFPKITFNRSILSFTTLELTKFTFDINTGEIIEKRRDTELEEQRSKFKADQVKKGKTISTTP